MKKCVNGWNDADLERGGWLDASGLTASPDTIAIEIALRRTRRTEVGVWPSAGLRRRHGLVLRHGKPVGGGTHTTCATQTRGPQEDLRTTR